MNPSVDPVTVEKLQAFARRRRKLISIRGACALVASLVVIMTVLALLDRFFLIPDPVRWVLSAIGYGLVAYVVWKLCIRFWFHMVDKRELARMVEHVDPSLREDLISAVELGDASSNGEGWDSEQFRDILQKDVAKRVGGVEVDKLLPNKMVSFWERTAVIAVVALVVLLLIPGLHFPKLLGRAMLPGANLERPSSIKVGFIEPAPADRIVPSGDTVEVLVSVEGGDVDKVILETVEEGHKPEKVRLKRQKGNRYNGAILVNHADIRYRVRAKGTITKFHTLDSRPRPQALEFAKNYDYPEYTGFDSTEVVEDHGDVSALEGSEVEV